jgi:hypothetical protein
MRIHTVLTVCAMLAFTSFAAADIMPIGQFTGDMSETFEDNLGSGTYPEVPLFEGNAILDDTLSGIAVITEWWEGGGGRLEPYEGELFGGTPTGSQVITFSTPITQFGGYISTVSTFSNATVSFFDEDGQVMENLLAEITPVTWAWQGWTSDVPISKIQFTGSGPMGNRPVQFDNLEVVFVPEPTALAIFALGAGVLLRRRR